MQTKRTKRCSNPNCRRKNPQPVSEFYKHPSNKDRLQNRCSTCLAVDTLKSIGKHTTKTKSGMAVLSMVRRNSHPLLRNWIAMMSRCFCEKHEGYKNYGGRGITVCEEWRDFSTFEADILRILGPRPKDKVLHRLDNDGDYTPTNVAWGNRGRHKK